MVIQKSTEVIKKNQAFFGFLLIIGASLFLFYPSLNYYFFQDDWFVLNWVREGDWRSFFTFRTDIIYWRPLTMPIFFKIGKAIFDLNPFGFHAVAFVFHFINIVLIYILFRTLKIDRKVSLLSSFLYATASFHFVTLSWLSTTSYVIGPTFIFSALILFLTQRIIISFIFFAIALASSEFALVVIPILLILKGVSKSTLKQLLPFFVISAFYLIVRFFIFPLPKTDQYEIHLEVNTLTNLFWYFVWAFNIPEKMSTIFFLSTLKQSTVTSLQFIKYLILPIILIIIFLSTVFMSKQNVKKIIIGFSWFIFGISPVLFLPRHTFPMYLTVGAVGLLYLFASSVEKLKIKNNIFFILFCTVWFISSYLTLSFTRATHWIVNEQAISKAYTNYTRMKITNPKQNSIFVFRPADLGFSTTNSFILDVGQDMIRQSLNYGDAVKMIYNDSTLKSVYVISLEGVKFPKNTEVYVISPSN